MIQGCKYFLQLNEIKEISLQLYTHILQLIEIIVCYNKEQHKMISNFSHESLGKLT